MTQRCLPLALLLPVLTTLSLPAHPAPDATSIAADAAAGRGQGADVSGAAAPGLTLRNCDLSGSNWSRADLRGASFTMLSLRGGDLSQANLRGAVLAGVDLTEANLVGVDLSGAILRGVLLEGATMAACRTDGALFDHPLLSATGASHLTALRSALQTATGVALSRAQVAALSGDAFTFVYNTQDATFWPGQPFIANPLLAAPAALGLEAKLRQEYQAEKLLMDEKESAKGVQMLPVRMPAAEQALSGGGPVWAVVAGRQVEDKHTYFNLLVPLLGTVILRKDELTRAWAEQADTLEPVGAVPIARHALLTIAARPAVASPADQLRAAVRQAAAVITDKRTYGPLVPGEAGLLRLAGDLRVAAEKNDWEAARRLGAWQHYPLQCLRGARKLAAEYLAGAAEAAEGTARGQLQEAANVYQLELSALDRWPLLPSEAQTPPAGWQDLYRQAAELVAGLAAAEGKAAQAMTAAIQ